MKALCKRVISFLLAVCMMVSMVPLGYAAEEQETNSAVTPISGNVKRIAGDDRIATSLGIATQLKDTLNVDKFETVVVASALNFPDALTGSYLAAKRSAPILLTYEAANAKIQAYIEANLAEGGTVYILGGSTAVSTGFEQSLTSLGRFQVKRLAGADRFGTNIEIMKEAVVNQSDPVLIATAVNFADSLSASAAGLPMLLVHGSLKQEQKDFLATTSGQFIIVGGTSAVSPALEAELNTVGTVIERLAGNSRYQTSVKVAQRFVPNHNSVILAYARNFPDGLCAGPLAYAMGAPLILTDNYDPREADEYVSGISRGFVVGGSGLISDVAARAIFDLGSGTPGEDPVEYYTVTFVSNGGSAVTAQVVEEGKTVTEPTAPTRGGYTFAGWYSDATLTTPYDFATPVTDNVTVYAAWRAEALDPAEDVDGDGIPNEIEQIFELSAETDDADGDGIDDYTEIYKIGSNPAVADSSEDLDDDGLSNYDETFVYGTSASKADSDLDNLSDFAELNTYRTNPLVFDTDADGVGDGYEVELGTNPLIADEAFQISQNNQAEGDSVSASVEIELSGDQVSTLKIDPVDNEALFPTDMPGYLGMAYDFSVKGDFDTAVIKFEFDPAILQNGADPAIFYFNEADQTLEELKTTIEGNVASATVQHFSTYILIDRTVHYASFTWEDVWDTEGTFDSVEVVLVIDDSGSLGGDYSYDSTTGYFNSGNDPEHLRLAAARNFVDKSSNAAKIGIVKFDSTVETFAELTTCTDAGKDSLKNILQFTRKTSNTSGVFDSKGSTYMYTGISAAFDLFTTTEETEESVLRAVIVFTDGNAHDASSHSSVIAEANNLGVRIYTVGLGSSTSYFTNYLQPLAEETGGTFYMTSNADQLASIYDDISKKIDLEADADTDGIPDYYEDHMIAFNGTKIKLDKNDADTDDDGLTDGEEVIIELVYNADHTQVYVKGKVLTDPSLVDTDFDGITDYYDNAPRNNFFAGELKTEQANSSVGYSLDYRWFFKDSASYNKSLARTSLLLSSFIYAGGGYTYDNPVCYKELGSTTVGSLDIRTLMEIHGFEDIKIYDLDNEYQKGNTNSDVIQVGYTDDDVTEVAIGHHNVTYNGTTKDVVIVVVRGTNGTIEEWASNFDLGDPNTSDANWNNSDNHRGFDVTTARVHKLLTEYASTYLTSAVTAYWVMGHSRGAAIANILSAMLIDDGENVFGYTFATPNTTIAADANSSKYDSIFNLVNEDDFVPCVPMAAWNFVRYGRSATLDMTSDMENEWHDLVGKLWYNQMSEKNLAELVDALANASTGNASQKWENCFVYTCDCADHGDGSCDDITEKGINDINDIPSRVRQYSKYSLYETWYGGNEYQVCQLPAYFMQALADIITTSGTWDKIGKVASTYQFASRYEHARNEIVLGSTVGGINCPHYCETYYLLTGYAGAGDFN